MVGISVLALAAAAPEAAAQHAPRRPVNTYSIVAVDSATGQIGAAVQSHWFSVGSIVTWAEPGVGAVATQSFVDPSYGPRGLYLMRSGISAPAALTALLRAVQRHDAPPVPSQRPPAGPHPRPAAVAPGRVARSSCADR